MTGSFTRIRLEGDAHERGRQHGQAGRDQIRAALEVYGAWLTSYARIDKARAHEFGAACAGVIASHYPELVTEMEGIAEGAGVPFLDVMVLNARTEIAYGASGLLGGAPTECTAFGLEASRSSTGAVVVGQNWDWLPGALENTVLLHATLEDGTQFLTVTEAGMLAKFGVNSHGVALAANMLACNRSQPGAPFHVLARAVLGSPGLTSALRSVTSTVRAGSGNFLLGSAEGDVVDLEWTPEDYAVLHPVEGVVTHANHFEAPLSDGVKDRTKILATASPGTYLRSARLRRLLGSHRPTVGLDDALAALTDHTDLPEAICRHDGGPGHDVFGQTNASFLVDFSASVVHLTHGPPCENTATVVPMPWVS